MLRNLLCAGVVLTLSIGLAVSAEIKGRITKVEGQKITVSTGKKGNVESKEYDVAKDVKVCKKTEDGKEPIAGGLTAIQTGKKGVGARIVTDDENKVTEIILVTGRKKKNN